MVARVRGRGQRGRGDRGLVSKRHGNRRVRLPQSAGEAARQFRRARRELDLSEDDAIRAVTEPLIAEIARLHEALQSGRAGHPTPLTPGIQDALRTLNAADMAQVRQDPAEAARLFESVPVRPYRALVRRGYATGARWPLQQVTPAGWLLLHERFT